MSETIEMSVDEMTRAAGEAAAMLRLMSNPARLLLLCHLVEGERSVGELMERTGREQAYVSQQLARLRDEGLVEGVRLGRQVRYRLADERVAPVLEALYCAFCRGSGAA